MEDASDYVSGVTNVMTAGSGSFGLQALGSALEALGHYLSTPKTENHHVVPQSHPKAQDARDNMENNGLDPKTEPTNQTRIGADKHNVTKRDSYVTSVNDRVKVLNSKESIQSECCKIADELQNSTLQDLDKKYPRAPR